MPILIVRKNNTAKRGKRDNTGRLNRLPIRKGLNTPYRCDQRRTVICGKKRSCKRKMVKRNETAILARAEDSESGVCFQRIIEHRYDRLALTTTIRETWRTATLIFLSPI